jgi:hypothetical protein
VEESNLEESIIVVESLNSVTVVMFLSQLYFKGGCVCQLP